MEGAYIAHKISVRTSWQRLTRIVVIPTIPFEFLVFRFVDCFTPAVVNDYFKAVQIESKHVKDVIFIMRTRRPKNIRPGYDWFTIINYYCLVRAGASKHISQINAVGSLAIGNVFLRGVRWIELHIIFKPIVGTEISGIQLCSLCFWIVIVRIVANLISRC